LLYNIYDPQTGYKVTVFTRHAVPGSGTTLTTDAVSVRFEFYQYETGTNVNTLPPGSTLSPQQFFVGGGDLKFNVRINNWPFADPQNSLVLTMGFAFPSDVSLIRRSTSFGTAYTFSCAQASTTLNLLSDSVNDETYQPVASSATHSTAKTASLQLTFQSFQSDLFFDPSLHVLVSPESQ